MSALLSSESECAIELTVPMVQNHLLLGANDVHVWFAFPDQLNQDQLIRRYIDMLSSDERDSYRRLQQPEHKQEYLVSHALLRTVLSQYADREPAAWQFLHNSFGKPSVLAADKATNLRVNLAHTNGLAVCAVSRAELGVDVEFHSSSRALLEMADHYFSAREVSDLQRLPVEQQEARFFRYWTLKEAYIKAKGEGLVTPSTDFSFEFSESGKISFTPPLMALLEADDWSFHVFSPAANYTAAIAVNSPVSSVQLFKAIPDHSYEKQKL